MRVLWITNILFPEASIQLTGNDQLKASGGWLLGSANMLERVKDVNLYVATVSTLVNQMVILKGGRITYFVIPYGKGNQKYNIEYEPYWREIEKIVEPDVVHIHGTEYTHGLAYVNACGCDNVVVSIQGMKSVASLYYHYGLTRLDIILHTTLRDIIKGGILRELHKFKKQGEYEIELISKVSHVIGRTSWDRANIWAINSDACYHFCNETLRPEFYEDRHWTYENCCKHTIFLSQSGYAIKGLHQLLRAMPIILRYYPDAQIRVAGNDISDTKNLSSFIRFTGYGNIIKSIIKKYHLETHVSFTGPLTADEMVREYLSCNVFVCPSSIENSPNSLGEAQILGTPVLATYVGGIPDMMKGNEDNLYRFEEVNMLAEKICRVFADEDKCKDMSEIARHRHNRDENLERLIAIYKLIQ